MLTMSGPLLIFAPDPVNPGSKKELYGHARDWRTQRNDSNVKLPQLAKRLRLPRVVLASALCLCLAAGITYSMVALSPAPPAPRLTATAFPVVQPTVRYGVALDTFRVYTDTIREGQTLSDLLQLLPLEHQLVFEKSLAFNEMLDVRNLRVNKTYTVLDDPDTEGPDLWIYEPSPYRYVRLDLRGDERSALVEKTVTKELRTEDAVIESSLWNALAAKGHQGELIDKMEDALQWSVDFHHVQPNDAFNLVYERDIIEEEEVGFGRVRAARYNTGGKDVYAFYFEAKDTALSGYFGLNGEPMKATFLKAPVRFSRISSRYNLRRFHPVQKRVKAHYGTDYAAPYGTPIVAVADGVVSRRGRTGGNGNFVKLRHNKKYSTQYLHMQKFAEGVTVGTRVKQGDVIGYVGSTGLATGPHVCYRFWEDGKQVDHTRIEFPTAEPMPERLLPEFFEVRDRMLTKLGVPVVREAK